MSSLLNKLMTLLSQLIPELSISTDCCCLREVKKFNWKL